MKRTSAILILLAFCFYSFTLKTHYCFYIETDTRFHGDCEHEIKDAAAKGMPGGAIILPGHYVCYDFLKDAKPDLPKLIVVKTGSDLAVVPIKIQKLITKPSLVGWLVPEINSRGGPPLLLFNSFRGPPLI